MAFRNRRQFLRHGLAVLAPLCVPAWALAQDESAIRLIDLYNKDLSFSDLALSLKGQRISVRGFMAPPLKADSKFFVLTRRPMATCPFCESEADWPDDILAIYTKRVVQVLNFNVPIEANGVLELGTWRDPEFSFVSRVRLRDTVYERA